MNVQQLREAIKDLPGDMAVTVFTTGESEFTVAIATIYERTNIKPRLMLGNDPNEFDDKNEKLLHSDGIECPDCGDVDCEKNH